MQKSSWKYKKILNEFFYSLRSFPFVLKLAKSLLYIARKAFSRGKPPTADIFAEKLISNSQGYLYIANPKVATRSIIEYLKKFDGENISVQHASLQKILSVNECYADFYWFSFVRNPWARTYSCWLDKITNQHKFCDITIISRYKGLYPDMPFELFVEWLCTKEGQDNFADRHWMSQHELLGGDRHIDKINFVGKIENLNEDFSIVSSEIKVGSNKLPAVNINQKDPFGYRTKYNEKTKSLIEQRYSQDIAHFNYEF